MKKRKKGVNSNQKRNSKKGIRYHIKHKSKLTSLLIVKIILALFSFGIVIIVYSSIDNVLGIVISAVVSFAIACLLYLSLVVQALKMFKL